MTTTLANWSELIGHDRVATWFRSAMRQQKLAGSFLFVGPPGVGKTTVAMLLTQTIFCERRQPIEMNPCGQCPSCIQVVAGTHPDLVQVAKPRDRAFIPLDTLIGPPDARMQQGFCRDVRMRPIQAERKIAIIHDADHLNEEGANCLLKTLEEPPRGSLMILVGTSEQKQLPTIRSRCRVIRLGPLPLGDAIKRLKSSLDIAVDENQIAAAIDTTGGDLVAAAAILSDAENVLRANMTATLGPIDKPHVAVDPVGLTRLINKHVDGAGKDSSKKRLAMKEAFATAIAHYRAAMRSADPDRGVAPITLRRLDRSIRAVREVDRMANPSTLVECFATDIAAGLTGDRGEIGS